MHPGRGDPPGRLYLARFKFYQFAVLHWVIWTEATLEIMTGDRVPGNKDIILATENWILNTDQVTWFYRVFSYRSNNFFDANPGFTMDRGSRPRRAWR